MKHKFSIIESNNIDPSVKVHEFCLIGKDVSIGKNTIVFPNVVITGNVEIGSETRIYPGTFIGKPPDGAGLLSRKPEYIERISIGKNCAIGPNAVIYYDVVIGDNVLLGDGASVREKCIIGDNCLISRYVTINYNSRIGVRTKIMDGTHITGNSRIGNDVFIGPLVSTANDNNFTKRKYTEMDTGPIIEDGVSIGEGAIILPAINIKKNAAIGAGAVVTKDVLAETLVRGVPARPK